MGRDLVATDRDTLAWCLRQTSVPHHKFAALCPDFLVISPPKTGSTWLAANLRAHPAVFVPKIKEVKYFSCYFKWLDLNWYLDQFAGGAGRVKGEASPSYAILPVEKIRLIRRLMPDVKILFLMRDPVFRAWSHARHNHRYREANFASGGSYEDIGDARWQENFTHEWPLAAGDYLGQLRRWRSVFPREQFYVGFYEDLARRPEALLREVFAFLGVTPDVDFAAFPARERILTGPPGELSPALHRFLRRLLHDRTRELASYLRESFGLDVPPEWDVTLAPPDLGCPDPGPVKVFAREFDDGYLARVLAQEEAFPSSPNPVLEGYRGHEILYYRGQLYAVAEELGEVRVNEMDEVQLRQLRDTGRCFIAPSLAEVKEQVDQYLFERAQTQVRDAHERISCLEQQIRRAEVALREVEDAVARLTPWYVAAWRRLWGKKTAGAAVWASARISAGVE
jgi:hypothetical protein